MKKLMMLPIIFIFISCAQEKDDVPQPIATHDRIDSGEKIIPGGTDCLAAFYPFTGNANDMSLYDNHGIVSGAVLTTDRFGHPNRAYYFDGVDDAILAPDQPQLQLQDEFTISSWVFPEVSKSQVVVRKGPEVNGEFASPYALGTSGTGNIVFHVRPGGTYNSVTYPRYSTSRWYMLTTVYSNGTANIYINNNLVAKKAIPEGTFNYDSQPLLIGTRLQVTSNSFKGKIDEVRIYCRALSSRDVATLYSDTAPKRRGG